MLPIERIDSFMHENWIQRVRCRQLQDKTEELKVQLLRSHWPKCNAIAEELSRIGGSAVRQALVEALQAKRHHIRTAAIRALVAMDDPQSVEPIRELLADASYETRMEAKAAIKALTGRDVLTARGE